MASCHSTYVLTNQYGRQELKNKRYKEQFKYEMLAAIDTAALYFEHYKSNTSDYCSYSYLRFFSKGQYAYFTSSTDSVQDTNNLAKAKHVGYFIVKDNVIILETPTGNFNTRSYNVKWEFIITEDGKLNLQNKFLDRTFNKADGKDLKPIIPDW
jgi:hypothetical protein